MKRHPFFDNSFMIRLVGGDKIVSVMNLIGGDSARIVDLSADRVFIMTSRVAHKIACVLVSDPEGKERLAYGTGYRFENVLTLDDFVLVETKDSSRAHVDPDAQSRIHALGELDRYGMALHTFFHSHPGNSEDSVNPSPTDLETLRHLEAQYGAIGAICNVGGWLQFFSSSQLFQILIVGKGVEDHGFREQATGFRHLFRLSYLDANPVQAGKTGWLGRITHRTARTVSLV